MTSDLGYFRCPSCQQRLPDDSRRCPACQNEISAGSKLKQQLGDGLPAKVFNAIAEVKKGRKEKDK